MYLEGSFLAKEETSAKGFYDRIDKKKHLSTVSQSFIHLSSSRKQKRHVHFILLYGDKSNLDQLQFNSYQPNISTNMCTWMAIETIDFFTRNGSEMHVCDMDMSKAFDRVKHSLLFKKLVEKGLSGLYICWLLVMYQEQTANVRWNNETSYNFSLSNGVKQGAVLSAILFCVYVDDLYKLLRKQKSGCWIKAE